MTQVTLTQPPTWKDDVMHWHTFVIERREHRTGGWWYEATSVALNCNGGSSSWKAIKEMILKMEQMELPYEDTTTAFF
jgi:hypothetical protein